MVLILILMLQLVCTTDPSQQYEKVMHRTIKKSLGIDGGYSLEHDGRIDCYRIVSYGNLRGRIMVSSVAACHIGGCVAPSEHNNSGALASEYFDALILLDANDRIRKIKILDYFSDYGYEVNSGRYLKKFENKHVCDFAAGQDGIDAISGATISSMALEGIISQLCDN